MRNADKSGRLESILRIVGEQPISSQDELLSLLKKEGYVVTQATLSRDIKALKIVKVPDGHGGYRYVPHSLNAAHRTVKSQSGVVSVEISGQMCVVRTLPGYASVTAAAIDDANVPCTMGTIAGDDTVLVILSLEANPSDVYDALAAVLPDFSITK